MKKDPTPAEIFKRQSRWLRQEVSRPKTSAPVGVTEVPVRYLPVNRGSKFLEKLGAGVSLLALGVVAYIGFNKITASESPKTVCDNFAGEEVVPVDSPGPITQTSSISMPSASNPAVGVENTFSYQIDTNTQNRSLARSCALLVPVELVVDPIQYAQTALSQVSHVSAEDLTVASIFSGLNSIATSETADIGTKTAAYEACLGELNGLELKVGQYSDAFANVSFPASFIADLSQPKQRTEFAPYTIRPLPTDNFRELIFTDAKGGVLTCEKPA